MGTLNMKPDNLILLAAVGIGAWWLLRRPAQAGMLPARSLLPGSSGATAYARPAASQPDPFNPLLNVLGQKLGGWLGTNTAAPAIVGPDLVAANPAPGQWASDAQGNGLF